MPQCTRSAVPLREHLHSSRNVRSAGQCQWGHLFLWLRKQPCIYQRTQSGRLNYIIVALRITYYVRMYVRAHVHAAPILTWSCNIMASGMGTNTCSITRTQHNTPILLIILSYSGSTTLFQIRTLIGMSFPTTPYTSYMFIATDWHNDVRFALARTQLHCYDVVWGCFMFSEMSSHSTCVLSGPCALRH